MQSLINVEDYILNARFGREILIILRDLILKTELTETVKWGSPVYSINNKNVVGIGSFKSYTGLWFFQGAFLKDEAKVLFNAQEGTTKSLRQWRFKSIEEINNTLILQYINEAIENAKQGKTLKPDRNKPLNIPAELQMALDKDNNLKNRFDSLSISCRREYAEYIDEAKRAETRIKRVQKSIPMINEKRGLNDNYKN